MEQILSFADALAEVLRHAGELDQPRHIEQVALLEAAGRMLAAPVTGTRDQPPFARSTRDGFAVRSADVNGGANGSLRLLGLLRAGEAWSGPPLGSGEAVEIMTGAPVPAGADAVLMIEHTAVRDADRVEPEHGRRLAFGENIVPAGAEARAGAVLIPAGRRVHTPEISLAASCGCAAVPVYARPTVAIIATGDELVELEGSPAPWQIYNSNSYALASLVSAEGALPLQLRTARDTRQDLEDRLREAAGTDLLLFSGGVSLGKYDLVETVLREAGAEFFFTGALIQPGRPVVFGRVPLLPKSLHDGTPAGPRHWTYFFGLPGNPISTEVCFRLFVAPLLRALAGGTEQAPRFAEATLAEEVRGGSRVDRFLPALVEGDWEAVRVRPVPWQGSGDLAANARANGFVALRAGVAHFAAGDRVRVLLR